MTVSATANRSAEVIDRDADAINRAVGDALLPFVAKPMHVGVAARLRVVMVAVLAHRINLLIAGSASIKAGERLKSLAHDTIDGRL